MSESDKHGAPSRRLTSATSLGSAVLVALTPKCPLCVAVLLSYVGLGASTAAVVAPLVEPLALALAVAALVFLAYGEVRRARSGRSNAHCCSR